MNLDAQITDIESQRDIRPTLTFHVAFRGQNNFKLKYGEIKLHIRYPDNDQSAKLCQKTVYVDVDLHPQNASGHGFEFQLSDSDLDRIEDIRGGEDLLYLLEGSFHGYNQRKENFQRDDFALEDRIPRSDWADILTTFDFGDVQTIELYFPDSPAREHFEKAWTHVEDADSQFALGDWNGTLTDCRQAIQVLDSMEHVEDMDEIVGDRKWEKMGTLKGSLESYLSLGPHSEEQVGHDVIKRRDAQAALLMTKAMINYIGDARREYKR